MPPYITVPFGITPRRGFTAGLPCYCAGSYAYGQQDTRMYVTSVAVAANVVTLGVKMVEGNIPVLSALTAFKAWVTGTVVGGAPVNVAGVALTAVSINAATGVGTITYPATTGNLATTPDGGQVIIPVPEFAELLAVAKLQQFTLDPMGGYGITMTWSTALSAPATLALQLEGAINDADAEYGIIGVSQTTLSGILIATVPQDIRFVRVNVTAFTGGASPSLIAKLLQSMVSAN
jgi:hypothetical protein